jgi:hypothetical protein
MSFRGFGIGASILTLANACLESSGELAASLPALATDSLPLVISSSKEWHPIRDRSTTVSELARIPGRASPPCSNVRNRMIAV